MIFEKRGKWCVRQNGRIHKFDTKVEAEVFLGVDEQKQSEFEWKKKVPFFSKENSGLLDT